MVENRDPVVHLDRGFWIVTAVFAALSILGIFYWIYAPLTSWLPEAAVPANQIDALFKFLAASSTVLYIFVVGYLIYFSLKYRHRSTDAPDAIGVQIHDNHKLELWWTIIPAVFVAIMAIISVRIWWEVQVRPNNGLVVESIGHQWYYTFRYPDVHGEVTNEMHLPVGVPVTLHVTSSDVIHSFWVPAIRLKADMVPGLINTIRFTPTRVGRYPIICTEFCGTLHSTMDKQVLVIEDRAAFQKWYNGWQNKNRNVSDALPAAGAGAGETISLAGGKASAGQALFAQKCSACHALGAFSQRIVGPGLKGVLHDPAHPNLVDGDPATPQNVAKILENGYKGDMGVMPNQSANGLSNTDIANLVAYLNTLK